MTLGKPLKIFIGALSLWPIVYIFLFFGFMVTQILWAFQTGGKVAEPSSGVPLEFVIFFLVHIATMLLTIALLVFYIAYLFKSDRIPQDKKTLWAVVLFLGNMLAIPFFFCIYVWPDQWLGETTSTPVHDKQQ